LDLTIPGGMGGVETALGIQKIRSDTILVASSGYSDNPAVLDPEGHGFSGSLPKPFRLEDMADVLENLLAERNPPCLDGADVKTCQAGVQTG